MDDDAGARLAGRRARTRHPRMITVGLGLAVLLLAGCERTTISGLHVRSQPNTGSAVSGTLAQNGTSVRVACWVRGEGVYGHTVWYRISRPVSGYVSSYYVDTNPDGIMARTPTC